MKHTIVIPPLAKDGYYPCECCQGAIQVKIQGDTAATHIADRKRLDELSDRHEVRVKYVRPLVIDVRQNSTSTEDSGHEIR